MSQRQPKSPWQKKQKSRTIYSPAYQHWREVALDKGACHPEALRLSCLHARQFGYRPNDAEGNILNWEC